MTVVEKIIDVITRRGLRIDVIDGQPVLRGKDASQKVTPKLRAVVAEFRQQILDHLKLTATKPSPAIEPDWSRTVRVMDAFGQKAVVVNHDDADWKIGQVAWQYIGETGWRPIAGREDKFPIGLLHA